LIGGRREPNLIVQLLLVLGGKPMFWIGVAVGALATIGFLLAEHLIGQIGRHERVRLARKYFPKNSFLWLVNPLGARSK
jgi:hypothetical protein